jgi:hypothetical protein
VRGFRNTAILVLCVKTTQTNKKRGRYQTCRGLIRVKGKIRSERIYTSDIYVLVLYLISKMNIILLETYKKIFWSLKMLL